MDKYITAAPMDKFGMLVLKDREGDDFAVAVSSIIAVETGRAETYNRENTRRVVGPTYTHIRLINGCSYSTYTSFSDIMNKIEQVYVSAIGKD